MGIAQRTVKGMIWAYAAYWGKRLFSVATTAILARILVPEDFGLIGFALLLLNFVDALRSFGINDALIYNTERPEDTTETAFIFNTAIGLGQGILTFALAPLSLLIFDDPRLVDIIRVMSVGFVFTGLGQTHSTLMQKELQFRRRFGPDIVASILKGGISITLALFGLNVWSLVLGHVAGSLINTVVLWAVLPWRPRFRFFADRARSLWAYGVHILTFEILQIALDQADQLFIGVLLGAVQLGYYSIAARLPELVIANFSMVLTTVLFPTYAKLKDDRDALITGYLKTTKYSAFVTVAAGCGMAAVAPELVRVVFGSQWTPAIILLQVLAFLGLVLALPWAAGDVFKAVGRPDIPVKLMLIESIYTFPLIWIMASRSGLAVMASLANLIAAVITVFLRLGVLSRYLKLNPIRYFGAFSASFLGGALMYGAVTGWRLLLASLPDIVVLISSVLVGAVVYGLTLFLLERKDLIEAWQIVSGIIRQRMARGSEEQAAAVEP